MKTFKQFLNEATRKPIHTAYVSAKLRELKPALWEQDLHAGQIHDILNAAFVNLLVRFEEAFNSSESNYSAAGLDGGSISPSGWITVGLTSDIDDVLNGKTHAYYEDFSSLCTALIAHELTHRDQFLKAHVNTDTGTDPSDIKSYLSDHREIDAYAVQTSLELLSSFSLRDLLAQISGTRNLEHLAMFSDGLKLYLHTFDGGDKVLKRFLKKLHDVLTSSDQ